MGIFTITHGLCSVDCHAECRRSFFLIEIVEDRAVVARTYGKRLFCKPAALFERWLRSVVAKHFCEGSILLFWCNDDYIIVVLCSGADERNAAYIDFFDYIFVRCSWSNCIYKGVEVDYHQVNLGNFILLDLLPVAFVFTTVKDSAKHFGMEGLYTTTKNGRIAGEVFN